MHNKSHLDEELYDAIRMDQACDELKERIKYLQPKVEQQVITKKSKTLYSVNRTIAKGALVWQN